MKRLCVTAILLGSVLWSGSVAAAASVNAWPSALAGAQGAAYNAGETGFTPANAPRLQRVWTRTVGENGFTAPAIVGGVVYHVVNAGPNTGSAFTATDVRTGSTLWTTTLPVDGTYLRGQSIQGNVAVLPFDGFHYAGGVTAVDLNTHRIVWSVRQPAPLDTSPGNGAGTSGPVLVDAQRVYMWDGSNTLNVFRLGDGHPVWSTQAATPVRGAALGEGVVYTGGDEGVVAYDAATGHRRWSAPGWGPPVLAGGRVFSALPDGLVADAATCQSTRCPSLWTRQLGTVSGDTVAIGGVSASTLFVAYTIDGTPSGGHEPQYGRFQRLSASTGAIQWTGSAGTFPGPPVRAGNTVWTVDNGDRLYGFSAAASSTAPLVAKTEPAVQSVVQGTAIASGTLVIQIWPNTLVAYRPAG